MDRVRRTSMIVSGALASILGGASVGAQVTLDPDWPENPRTFGTDRWEEAYCVRQTSDGGYLVAGYAYASDPQGDPQRDAYLIRLDAAGQLDSSWDPNPRTFGGDEYDDAFAIEETPDGGFIVVGRTASFGAGQFDAYLIKIDARGNLDPAWDPNPATFGGASWDSAGSIVPASDGGYIVVAQTDSFGAGGFDVYLIKLDAHGKLDGAWNPNPKTFGGPEAESPGRVQRTDDGGYVVPGGTRSFGAQGLDGFVLKLDAQGNLDPAWDANPRIFGGERDDGASEVRPMGDGGYLVAGTTSSFGAGREDIFVLKLDSLGRLDPSWDPNPRTFGGPNPEYLHSLDQTADGGFILVGWTASVPGGITEAYLIRLDADGDLDPAWDPNPRTFGGDDEDLAAAVQQTTDGGFIVAGTTLSFGAGREDALILKLAPSRRFLRGDCNGDGLLNGVPDAVMLLEHAVFGGREPPCLAACDVDGNGATGDGVTEALYLLRYFFLGAEAPSAPFPACGAGQLWTDGPLGCRVEPPCA